MQVKLLRAIQESEFERVGGIKTIKVDVRLITATNRDLEQEIQRGNFREDLFYRLNVVPLQIPPLRKRTGDIPLLVQHIIKKFNERLKKTITGIADDALAALEAHTLAGQHPRARERPRAHDPVLQGRPDRARRPPARDSAPPSRVLAASTTTRGAMPPVLDDDDDDEASARSSGGSLKEIVRAETARVERELIVKALDETGGNVTQAARLLKISRKSLQMKMKEFGLRDREG